MERINGALSDTACRNWHSVGKACVVVPALFINIIMLNADILVFGSTLPLVKSLLYKKPNEEQHS